MPRIATKKKVSYVRAKKASTRKKRVVRNTAAKAVQKQMLRDLGGKAKGSKRSSNSALGTAIGTAIGAALGGPGGGALGGMVGNAGGRFMSSIFGHGDYGVSNAGSIKENNLALSNSAQAPQFGTGKVAVNLTHREFLGDIVSSSVAGAFKIESYPINPGLAQTFPWLAGVVGGNFQQYRINGMTFEFRSMSGDALNSVNTALGSVIMSSDYDSSDNPFTTKQQMENTEYGVSCKPSTNMLHAIECARSQTSVSELYIRSFANPAGTDVRLYDMARFYIASVGCQGTSVNLGELWVTYDIDVFKAIEQPPGFTIPMIHMNLAATDATKPLLIDTSVNATQPVFDTVGIASKTNSVITMPLSIANGSRWLLIWAVRGGSTANLVPPAIVGTGGMVAGWGATGGFINGSSGAYLAPQTGATGTTDLVCYNWTYNGTGTLAVPPAFTFGTTGTFPGATVQGGDLIIVQVNGNGV